VEGADAYKIPPEPFPYKSGQPIVAVSGFMEDMDPIPPTPTKIIQNCAMDNVDITDPYPVKSACSFSGGASGTGELVEEGDGVYLAAIHASLTAYPDAGDALNLQRHYNADTAVTGEFRQAILDAMSAQP
jgi:hypothetical protein